MNFNKKIHTVHVWISLTNTLKKLFGFLGIQRDFFVDFLNLGTYLIQSKSESHVEIIIFTSFLNNCVPFFHKSFYQGSSLSIRRVMIVKQWVCIQCCIDVVQVSIDKIKQSQRFVSHEPVLGFLNLLCYTDRVSRNLFRSSIKCRQQHTSVVINRLELRVDVIDSIRTRWKYVCHL